MREAAGGGETALSTGAANEEQGPARRGGAVAAALVAPALGMTLTAWAYWPGMMIDDSRWQYQQALDGRYDDWHPPLMAWAWHWLSALTPGPAPMLLLQLLLYWGGIALVATAAARRGQMWTALALGLVGWYPSALLFVGTVVKDVLMTGCLASAVGLILWRREAQNMRAHRALAAAAVLALVLAAALRFNAFLACAPLAAALVPPQLARTRARRLGAILAAGAALMLVMPAFGRAIGAARSDVDLSLILFDLGGITQRSGKSQFPPMGVRDPVAANRGCYSPSEWDGYSNWAHQPCRLGFEPFRQAVRAQAASPVKLWLRAAVSHPIAYARHRLDHFNRATWFMVPAGSSDMGWGQSDPNPWGYEVRANAALAAIQGTGAALAETPFFWPFFWVALAASSLLVAERTGLPVESRAIALSALLYGLGYLVFGVATGMRYHLWTMAGAAVAAVLIAGELARRRIANRRGLIAAAGAIVALPSLLAVATRLG